VDEYKTDIKNICGTREPGISGFMRIRNEAEYLPQSIESHLPYLDELVIVYNRCTDGSDKIIRDYAEKHNKVKAFHYEPDVYPMGSKEYHELAAVSIHSFINYSNYALAKTTKKIVVKIDGDDIAIPNKIKFITENIRSGKLETGQYWLFVGINLWRHENKIYIPKKNPFPGLDHGFIYMDESVHYEKGNECEFMTGNYRTFHVGYMYYHAKGLKKGRGKDNYDLDKNPESYYAQFYYDTDEEELMTFDELIQEYPQSEELQYLPPPETYIKLS
jgi:hypothetical protein